MAANIDGVSGLALGNADSAFDRLLAHFNSPVGADTGPSQAHAPPPAAVPPVAQGEDQMPAATLLANPASTTATSTVEASAADFEFPSSSQVALNCLDESIRPVYRMAYAYVKERGLVRESLDWGSIFLQEFLNDAPASFRDRLRRHFDDLFEYVSNASSVPARASSASSDQATARPGLPGGDSVPAPPVASASVSIPSSLGLGAAQSRKRTLSAGADDESPEEASDRSLDGSSKSPGSDASSSSAKRRVIRSHSDQIRVPADAVGSQRHPALSKAAREASRNGEHKTLPAWQYCGLFRWEKRLSDENPLSFDALRQLLHDNATHGVDGGSTTSGEVGPMKYPFLRESWRCSVCQKTFNQEVGQTTNLIKHRKKCPVQAASVIRGS